MEPRAIATDLLARVIEDPKTAKKQATKLAKMPLKTRVEVIAVYLDSAAGVAMSMDIHQKAEHKCKELYR